eukprot:TRINITY_DN55535_c0_g1_i1.p1 TRINITY_DN55535_c0_g1~~TRINITY_DN55535_c0_g1_i1.p1  ORF type:complete len:421 (-),score=72.41 TRINITY_DN55535_c0_g1_i1:186-1448(-)
MLRSLVGSEMCIRDSGVPEHTMLGRARQEWRRCLSTRSPNPRPSPISPQRCLSTSSPNHLCDLRSDTVTRPSSGMMKAMVKAQVGDDVNGEDPSVNRLESMVAEMLGKEAGLFVPSGTMANQLAMRVHLRPLREVVCDARAHIHVWENGAIHALAGAGVNAVEPANGRFLEWSAIEPRLKLSSCHYHTPTTSVISLENTLNGACQPLEQIQEISARADAHGIQMHLDGARLWNLAVADCDATPCTVDNLADRAASYAQQFASVSVCLSKGLGAPIGSVLVANKEFIQEARHYRKMLGGGWRQAGMLAGAGMYAINHQWARMRQDHQNAVMLADGLVKLGFVLAVPVETSMVWVNTASIGDQAMATITAGLAAEGFHINSAYTEGSLKPFGSMYGNLRFVTHLDTPAESIQRFLDLSLIHI